MSRIDHLVWLLHDDAVRQAERAPPATDSLQVAAKDV
jgi:hypothetical protein